MKGSVHTLRLKIQRRFEVVKQLGTQIEQVVRMRVVFFLERRDVFEQESSRKQRILEKVQIVPKKTTKQHIKQTL